MVVTLGRGVKIWVDCNRGCQPGVVEQKQLGRLRPVGKKG